MLPYELLPRAAQVAAQLLPSTHAMNAFRGLAMGQTADFWPWGSVLILLAGGLTAFGLAFALFRWDSHHTARRLPTAAALLALAPYAAGIVAFR
jgi:ABC-2 type transport system permease protein